MHGSWGNRTTTPRRALVHVVLVDALLWGSALAADAWVETTSGRLCNAAYVLWVLAQVGLILVLAMLREVVSGVRAPPPLLDAVNGHPLSVFLFANLLTGACNLALDTMTVSRAPAAAVLAAYMTLVCVAAVALERLGGRWTQVLADRQK